jgi:hypothetical protein
MVNFRRVVLALTVLALFAGLAGAQQLTCNTNVTNTPQLRGEGFTEQTGDITITCTGGQPIAPGGTIPLVNISVYYNTAVTSRLLPTSSPQSSNSTSEALLLIDEPGAQLFDANNVQLYGAAQNQVLCPSPLTGCAAVVGNVAGTTFNRAVDGYLGTNGVTGTVPARNVYQGVVSGNSVTFFGVPVFPPTTNGSRTYRVTNVRVNAQPLAGGSASGATPVQASISVSGGTSLQISNSAPYVGYVLNGLSASASGATGLNQCVTQTRTFLNTLTFSENFGTAFKTRVSAVNSPAQNTSYAGQINNPLTQNVPGNIYLSESNFIFPIGSQTAGLADFGTRLKATFNNIPAGVRIFVSTANVINGALAITPPAVIGGAAANLNSYATPYIGYAVLVNGETTNDGNAGISGFFPAVAATDNASSCSGCALNISEVSLANGTGTAVWEVVNTNPSTQENFKFGVYTTYVAAVATNTPLPGTSTVNLSFAPTATSGAASSSLPIPRFAGDSSAARNILTINICRTILLYPYVTNQGGFDTGLTVANTSQDSFTVGGSATGAQAGACTFTYYGGTTAAPTTPPGPTSTGNIAAGTVWANTLGTIAPNFQGYAFAVCNFQYAHGFAFISDVGARNLAMGYLAIVIPDPGTGNRNASPACQGISGCSSTGEQDAH